MAVIAAAKLIQEPDPLLRLRGDWVIDASVVPLEVLAEKLDDILEMSAYRIIYHPDLWFDGRWE